MTNQCSALAVLVAFSICLSAGGANPPLVPNAVEPPVGIPGSPPAPSPAERQGFVFQDTPVNDAVREIGLRGKLNTVVSDGVTGNITLRTGPVKPANALRSIAKSMNLILVEKQGVFFFKTHEESAEETRLKDPAMLKTFQRLISKGALKSSFDALPCRQKHIQNRKDITGRYLDPAHEESLLRMARTGDGGKNVNWRMYDEWDKAQAVVAYRVHLNRVAVVFFGPDQHPSYSYLVSESGLGLP